MKRTDCYNHLSFAAPPFAATVVVAWFLSCAVYFAGADGGGCGSGGCPPDPAVATAVEIIDDSLYLDGPPLPVEIVDAFEVDPGEVVEGALEAPACGCYETDSGDDPYTAGKVIAGLAFSDYCVMRYNVIEQYCLNGVRRQVAHNCYPLRCLNGACIP
jgi:hypothetical protein